MQMRVSQAEIEMLESINRFFLELAPDPKEPRNITQLREDFRMFIRKTKRGNRDYCSITGTMIW
jgi:hypothetical protein